MWLYDEYKVLAALGVMFVCLYMCVSKGVKFIHVCVFMLCRLVISTPLFF